MRASTHTHIHTQVYWLCKTWFTHNLYMDMGNTELASLRYSGWGGNKSRGRVKVKSNWETETYLAITTSMTTITNISFKYFMINCGVGYKFCLVKYRGQNRWDVTFESASRTRYTHASPACFDWSGLIPTDFLPTLAHLFTAVSGQIVDRFRLLFILRLCRLHQQWEF